MNRDEIMKLLPHRNSMLLLDEAERIGDTAHGMYKVNGNEFFLDGHFPDFKVVPGVILCEILAQTACSLIDMEESSSIPVYAGLEKVRFKSPVRPGDEFRTECRITKARKPFYFCEGSGYVGDKLCITASFSFAVVDKDKICSQES